MDREQLISAMMGKGHTRDTAESAITGRGMGDLWREYMGGGSSGGSNFDANAYAQAQQKALDERLAKQEKKETDFLDRFRTAVEGLEPLSDIRSRIIEEQYPGYGNLKEGAYSAVESLRGIPENVQERAKQVGMSANRASSRIQQKVQNMQPFVDNLLNRLSFVEQGINQATGLEAQDRDRALLPLQQEAAMLSDRLAREITGYTTNMQNQTQVLLQKLADQGALERQELQNLANAALAEEQYFSSEITTMNGRKVLLNKRTGEVVADLGTSGGTGGDIESDLTTIEQQFSGTNSGRGYIYGGDKNNPSVFGWE